MAYISALKLLTSVSFCTLALTCAVNACCQALALKNILVIDNFGLRCVEVPYQTLIVVDYFRCRIQKVVDNSVSL